MKTKAGIEKSLAEWTLQDVKEACVTHDGNCAPCPLYHHCGQVFRKWDLSEKPEKQKFTEQEIQDAKSIMRIFGADNIVAGRDNVGNMTILVYRSYAGGKGCFINKDLFPSIGAGETFHLSEIVGDADA